MREGLVESVGTLIVPAESVGDYDDGGEDIDTGVDSAPVIARPGPNEWITVLIASVICTRLVRIQKDAKGFDVEFFYPAKEIRRGIADDIRSFRVCPYFSHLKKKVNLWLTPVSEPGTSGWGDTLAWLFAQPTQWHAERAIRVRADREAAKYRFRAKPITGNPSQPAIDTSALLGAAIGQKGFINDVSHPIYLKLQEGEEVG